MEPAGRTPAGSVPAVKKLQIISRMLIFLQIGGMMTLYGLWCIVMPVAQNVCGSEKNIKTGRNKHVRDIWKRRGADREGA